MPRKKSNIERKQSGRIKELLNLARLQGNPKIYSTTLFMQHHISIVDQQERVLDLIYALLKTKILPAKGSIAIVGAGFSGMTCAVAAAAVSECTIHMFEKDTVLLRRFRESPHRYIHPLVNTSTINDLDYYSHEATELPFMNWRGNYAHLVAEQIYKKFEHYQSTLPIALHLKQNVKIAGLSPKETKPALILDYAGSAVKCNFDLIIMATGFGQEKSIDEKEKSAPSSVTNDLSYWWSGRPTGYKPHKIRRRKKERVAIIGNGDSGIVELAHYLIPGLPHHTLLDLLLPMSSYQDSYLGKNFIQNLKQMTHRQMLDSELYAHDDDDFYFEGPIGWYFQEREFKSTNPEFANLPKTNFLNQEASSNIQNAYSRIYRAMDEHLNKFPRSKRIPAGIRAKALSSIRDAYQIFASYEIQDYVKAFFGNNHKHPNARVLRKLFTHDFHVTVVGSTPTIFSHRQAPINWHVMGILQHFGNFQYIYSRAHKYEKKSDGYEISLGLKGKQKELIADRLAVRMGPTYDYGFAKTFIPRYIRHKRSFGLRPILLGPKEMQGNFHTNRWKTSEGKRMPFDDSPDSKPDTIKYIAHANSALLFILSHTKNRKQIRAAYHHYSQLRDEDLHHGAMAALFELASTVARATKKKMGKL